MFESGAIWLRSDFHLHTRSDSEFRYDRDENGFKTNYIRKLQEKGIQLGVITNHNKFNLTEFEDLHKNALKSDIWLIPGIELSLKDGSKSGRVETMPE